MTRLILKAFEKVVVLDQVLLLALLRQVLVNMLDNLCLELLVNNKQSLEKPALAIAASLSLQKTRIH